MPHKLLPCILSNISVQAYYQTTRSKANEKAENMGKQNYFSTCCNKAKNNLHSNLNYNKVQDSDYRTQAFPNILN